MAHRKPLGTTCHVHFARDEWGYYPPEIDDYLETAAGTAYRIIGIEEGPSRNAYLLERVAECHPDARVFTFYWLPRGRKRVAA